MVPPCSHRVSRVRRYSGYCSLSRSFAYRTLTFFGLLSHTIQLSLVNTKCSPNPNGISTSGLASSAFARHYLRNLGWFLYLALLRCFSSGGSPHIPIWFSICCWSIAPAGCPIRKSTDIATIYVSPWLIAVNHVLRRLPVPRHSPCALYSLTFFSITHSLGSCYTQAEWHNGHSAAKHNFLSFQAPALPTIVLCNPHFFSTLVTNSPIKITLCGLWVFLLLTHSRYWFFVNSLQQNCNCYPIFIFVLWLFQRRCHNTNPIFSRLSLHSILCSVFKVRFQTA